MRVCGCFGIRFFVVYLEVLTIAKFDHQLNEEIRDKEIRLIGADGAQVLHDRSVEFAREYGMEVEVLSAATGAPGTVVAGLE